MTVPDLCLKTHSLNGTSLLEGSGRRWRLVLRIRLTKELQIVLPLKALNIVDNIDPRSRADQGAANENNIANATRHQYGTAFPSAHQKMPLPAPHSNDFSSTSLKSTVGQHCAKSLADGASRSLAWPGGNRAASGFYAFTSWFHVIACHVIGQGKQLTVPPSGGVTRLALVRSTAQCTLKVNATSRPSEGKETKRRRTPWLTPVELRHNRHALFVRALHQPCGRSEDAERKTRSRFLAVACALRLLSSRLIRRSISTLRLKFGEFLIFLRRHCDEIRNSGNRTGVQPMGMQVGHVEAAGSFGRQLHGGRTSAMPTARAGFDCRLGSLSRRVGC